MEEEKQEIAIKESSQLTLDVKSLVGILAVILSIAGVYFTLTGQLAQLQLDVIRMQDSVEMNSDFVSSGREENSVLSLMMQYRI